MFYVVRGLSPYTEYEFHVIGVNNIGRGPASSPVSTTTGETGLCRILKHLDNYKLGLISVEYCKFNPFSPISEEKEEGEKKSCDYQLKPFFFFFILLSNALRKNAFCKFILIE